MPGADNRIPSRAVSEKLVNIGGWSSRGRAEARPSQRLGRLLAAARAPGRHGRGPGTRREQPDRELVRAASTNSRSATTWSARRGIRGSRLRASGRACLPGQQLGQGKAAEVLRQAEVHGRRLVQLGYRRGHILASADLEEAGQRLRRGVGGVPLGQVLEVATALGVGACRYQRGGQGHHSVPVCPRPAGRLLQRSEQAIAGNWFSSHGISFLEVGPCR